MKKLKLNKISVQLLDDQSLVDIRGGLRGPISRRGCNTCEKASCISR